MGPPVPLQPTTPPLVSPFFLKGFFFSPPRTPSFFFPGGQKSDPPPGFQVCKNLPVYPPTYLPTRTFPRCSFSFDIQFSRFPPALCPLTPSLSSFPLLTYPRLVFSSSAFEVNPQSFVPSSAFEVSTSSKSLACSNHWLEVVLRQFLFFPHLNVQFTPCRSSNHPLYPEVHRLPDHPVPLQFHPPSHFLFFCFFLNFFEAIESFPPQNPPSSLVVKHPDRKLPFLPCPRPFPPLTSCTSPR